MGASSTSIAYEVKILQVSEDSSRSFKNTPISTACVTSY